MESKELKKKFKKKKKQLFKNIVTLRETLQACVDGGLLDMDSVFYNQLEALDEEMHTSEDPNELEEIIIRAQAFESQICGYYDNLGFSTTSLDWPNFENLESFENPENSASPENV